MSYIFSPEFVITTHTHIHTSFTNVLKVVFLKKIKLLLGGIRKIYSETDNLGI